MKRLENLKTGKTHLIRDSYQGGIFNGDRVQRALCGVRLVSSHHKDVASGRVRRIVRGTSYGGVTCKRCLKIVDD